MPSTTTPDPQLIAGRYRRVAVLGSGGMGTVYEAHDERLDRAVAVKVVHTTERATAQRLRAEATVLARLRHPSLVTVFDVGEHEGRPFVVTELVRGRPLQARLDEGPMPPVDVARLGVELASALACAHRHGIVHRDVKPGNVLLTEGTDAARLIDFGIAASDVASGLTSTGLVIGTPAYLAPEQVEGRRAVAASDVYALGLVLMEALEGERTFPGSPTESASARLVGDAPVPPDLPPGWAPLLASMTRRDPARRPAASEVADTLLPLSDPQGGVDDAALLTAPLEPATLTMDPAVALGRASAPAAVAAPPLPPAVVPRPSRRWLWWVAAVGLVLAAAVGLGAVVLGAGDEGSPTTDVPSTTAVPVTSAPPTTLPPTTTTAPPTTTTAPATVAPPPGPKGDEGEKPGKGKGRDD